MADDESSRRMKKFSESFEANVRKNLKKSDEYEGAIKGSAKSRSKSGDNEEEVDSEEDIDEGSEDKGEGRLKRGAKYAWSGKEGEGGIKRIGSGAAGAVKSGWNRISSGAQGKRPAAIGITCWIIAGVIFAFSWIFGGSFVLGLIFGIGFLSLKGIHFKGWKSDSKYAWAWKTFFVLVIIAIGVAVYFALAGTGAGKSTASKLTWYLTPNSASASDDLGMSLFTFDLSKNYIWQCMILNTLGVCDRAEMKGDSGGVFIARLETDLPSYFEAGPRENSIGLYGTVVGKAWTTATRAKAPDIRSTDVAVGVEWEDEAVKDQKWTCEQPLGANSDFYCSAKPLDLSAVKGQDISVCGTSWFSMTEGEGAFVRCPARITEEYPFSTLGFRMYRFSDFTSEVNFNDVTVDDVAWSTGAPVIVTVGQLTSWNSAVRPPKEDTFKVPIVIGNQVPKGLGTLTDDLTYDSLASKLGELTITMPHRDGIDPICNGEQVGTEIRCTYDFGNKEIKGAETEQYVLELKFGPNVDLSKFVEYSITADLKYVSKMSKLFSVEVKYMVEKTEEDQGGYIQEA